MPKIPRSESNSPEGIEGSMFGTGERGVNGWARGEWGQGLGQVREGSKAGTIERRVKGWDR